MVTLILPIRELTLIPSLLGQRPAWDQTVQMHMPCQGARVSSHNVAFQLNATMRELILIPVVVFQLNATMRELTLIPLMRELTLIPLANPLDYYASRHPDRDRALVEAYRTGAYSMQTIAEYFGVSRMTVSRAVNHNEQTSRGTTVTCEA